MYPKREIENLNLRRELNRRLQFIKKRLVETVYEFKLAQGKISELPEGMKVPPQWALDAARLAWDYGLGAPFKQLSQEEIKRDPRGCTKEIIGIYESMLAYVVHPSKVEKESDEARSALAEVRSLASKVVAKKTLGQLRKLDARLEAVLPQATPEELVAWGERYTRGAKSVRVEEDAFPLIKSLSGRICYLVWFGWPLLELMPQLRAEDLHKWLGEEFHVFASVKLVEAIYTELHLAAYKKRAG
jgi:hypothetical protein